MKSVAAKPNKLIPFRTLNRLTEIDALRGIAAFAVVLFHVYNKNDGWLGSMASYGFTGVFLFFVISGFCIHLRYTRDKEVKFADFWKRRWLRLYPGYIATLILFLPASKGVYDIVMHLLMLHNLDNSIVYSMNGVLWTLAIEEQLYLLYFPMLWMRKNWGWAATLSVCFIARFVWLGISLLSLKTFQYELPFHEGALTNWWTWALGALAVEVYYKKASIPAILHSPVVSLIALILAGWMTTLPQSILIVAITPIFWGFGFFVLINWVMSKERQSKITSAIAYLGIFSYSLYLTHEWVLQFASGLIGITASLIFAYIFYLVFEKPIIAYLGRQKKSEARD